MHGAKQLDQQPQWSLAGDPDGGNEGQGQPLSAADAARARSLAKLQIQLDDTGAITDTSKAGGGHHRRPG